MRGFSQLDNPAHQGETNTWLTPISLIRSLGEFDLDPCGYPGHPTASNLICQPDCGLSADWYGRVWLNPPYGKETGKWLDKLAKHGRGVALVFSRTDTSWFQEYAAKADWVFFIKGRIKFIHTEKGADTNAGHGSCLMGFGEPCNIKLPGITL
jgi:hypothetical protein